MADENIKEQENEVKEPASEKKPKKSKKREETEKWTLHSLLKNWDCL